jgi:hypothetical protein
MGRTLISPTLHLHHLFKYFLPLAEYTTYYVCENYLNIFVLRVFQLLKIILIPFVVLKTFLLAIRFYLAVGVERSRSRHGRTTTVMSAPEMNIDVLYYFIFRRKKNDENVLS